MPEILVNLSRNGRLDNVYRGDLVVVNKEGEQLFFLGSPWKMAYWRSAAKPLQVLPFLEGEGMKKFSLDDGDLALMCSSHSGEEEHVARVRSLLSKIGFHESSLNCGAAVPLRFARGNSLESRGNQYTPLHNCCSGKHAAMLALAALCDYSPEDYEQSHHPVQKRILQVISAVTKLPPEKIGIGIDGCGTPIFYIALQQMARTYALLSRPEDAFPQTRTRAMRRVVRAMTEHPWLVAGTGRLDTAIMEVTGGRILAKLGADGVYCMAVVNEGLGMAMKIESGEVRAIDPAAIRLLALLDLIDGEEECELRRRVDLNVYNHRREVTGQYTAVF